MKFDEIKNSNYCATVVKIKNIVPLNGCDNVVGTNIFGYQAIVGKDTQIGDVGIVFTSETQLADKFCYENNLYRHGNLNKDESAKGYLEDNRRIKAIRFRGHESSCLFMPLTSLESYGVNVNDLEVGNEFDMLNGMEVCKKYEVATKTNWASKSIAEENKFIRVDKKMLPEHISSVNYFKYGDSFNKNDEVIVTQKLHGTSVRIAHTVVNVKFNWIERLLNKFFFMQETEYDYVFGSRKVIKDINNPYQNHYYESDIWTTVGAKYSSFLPKNYIIYGEIIGWTEGGMPIQKNYTYNLAKGQNELYVYRIAIINEDGVSCDLSWTQVKQFCSENGIKHVPELWKGKVQKFDADKYMNVRLFDSGYKNCVKLIDNHEIVDEGVCIRKEGITPIIMKAKCSKFLEHETKILDSGDVDLESAGVETVDEVIINPNQA